jgi:hypothetical protein
MTIDPAIHPEALLAEYVEDALGPEERARVEAHLSTCARCAGEVDLARQARTSLTTLPDLEAPAGQGLAVRRQGRAAGGPSRAWRVVAPMAAAAVLVAGGIVVIRSLGGTGEGAGSPARPQGGGGAGGEATAAPEGAPLEGEAADTRQSLTGGIPRFSETPANYTQAGLVVLARSTRDEARTALDQGLARTATSFYSAFDVTTLPRDLRPIYRCVVAEVPPDQLIVPFTILEASFEDQPAYIASFLQGPAPDQPYDRLVIWVVGRDDCRLRSLASQRL